MDVERLASLHGNQALVTLDYQSDLQPIKMVWTTNEGFIGHQYNTGDT